MLVSFYSYGPFVKKVHVLFLNQVIDTCNEFTLALHSKGGLEALDILRHFEF